ncbi:MAG: iron-sulfur cluster assembly accessory protein [Cytophagales bacterium]|nr:iron-sulfur cluster assembly accessory protein [Cytophagales bacterium]
MEIQPVSITETAAKEIRSIMQNKGIPEGYCLRVLAEGTSGCGGVRYRLGFDKPREGDQQYTTQGIPVLYQKRHMMFLIGLEIDFQERETERGFVFNRK